MYLYIGVYSGVATSKWGGVLFAKKGDFSHPHLEVASRSLN